MTTTNMTPERLAEIQEVTTRWFNKKDLKESSREYFALVLELTAEVHRLQGELARVTKERDVFLNMLSYGNEVCPWAVEGDVKERDLAYPYPETPMDITWCQKDYRCHNALDQLDCQQKPNACWLKYAQQQAEKKGA